MVDASIETLTVLDKSIFFLMSVKAGEITCIIWEAKGDGKISDCTTKKCLKHFKCDDFFT